MLEVLPATTTPPATIPPEATTIVDNLERGSQLLAEARDDYTRLHIRDGAKAAMAAARVLGLQEVVVNASLLICRAERAIAEENAAIPPHASGAMRSASKGNTYFENPDKPVISTSSLSRMRAAHLDIQPDEYEAIEAEAIRRLEPLTRKHLAAIAQQRRLQAKAPDATRLRALQYIGGKNGSQMTGPWIRSLLPYHPRWTYCEPYFGMGSILLNRPKANTEIANDLNARLFNWWTVLQKQGEELKHIIRNTIWHKLVYDYAKRHIDDPAHTDLERAVLYHILIDMSIMRNDLKSGFFLRYQPSSTRGVGRWPESRWDSLIDRIKDVQFDCRDAADVLKRTALEPNIIVYCDPPYPSADQSLYLHQDIDQPAISELLRQQQGLVAISGQEGDAWGDLLPDWHTSVKDGVARLTPTGDGSHYRHQRTEMLWTNYDPHNIPSLE
ncbi:MAG: DNA adenine methylase [Chloroflexi bacterium]|nr:DNA adenine methylase [Chloroflexota bacterium]